MPQGNRAPRFLSYYSYGSPSHLGFCSLSSRPGKPLIQPPAPLPSSTATFFWVSTSFNELTSAFGRMPESVWSSSNTSLLSGILLPQSSPARRAASNSCRLYEDVHFYICCFVCGRVCLIQAIPLWPQLEVSKQCLFS